MFFIFCSVSERNQTSGFYKNTKDYEKSMNYQIIKLSTLNCLWVKNYLRTYNKRGVNLLLFSLDLSVTSTLLGPSTEQDVFLPCAGFSATLHICNVAPYMVSTPMCNSNVGHSCYLLSWKDFFQLEKGCPLHCYSG